MVVPQQTARQLVLQAVALMEKYLTNRPKEPVASAYRSDVLLSLFHCHQSGSNHTFITTSPRTKCAP